MIKIAALFATILLLIQQLSAQDCIFNEHIRTGSQYYFSTFFADHSRKNPLQDTCQQNMNGKPYRFYVFKDGIIQVEKLYYNPNNALMIDYNRVNHDSVFAEMRSYDSEGRIKQHVLYYHDKGGNRCMKDQLYYNGALYHVRHLRSVHSKELADASLDPRPEHLIDSEGYTDYQVQFGEELYYFETGGLKSRQMYQYVVTNNPNSYESKTGAYTEYYEDGKLKATGFYDKGANDSTHLNYFPDGSTQKIMHFQKGIYIGIWKSYYPNGQLETVVDNDPKYGPNIGHEIHYYPSGTISYERKVEYYSKGFKVYYYENGKPKDWTRYEHGAFEETEHRTYYENGQLTHVSYYRPQNDTSSVVYFQNGYLARINIQRKNGEQDYREYYESGQIRTNRQTRIQEGVTQQIHLTFYANGQIQSQNVYHSGIHDIVVNWSDGTLKTEKHYTNNLLNGLWKERDSTGRVTKNCIYKNGYRVGKSCTFDFPKLPLVSTQEKTSLRAMINDQHACSFNTSSDTVMLTDKELEEQTTALVRLYSYLKLYGKQWKLDSTAKTKKFTYTVMIPEGIYNRDRKKIDAIFASNGWEVKFKMESGYANGNFTSPNFYNLGYFNMQFAEVFAPNSGYFGIESTCNLVEKYHLFEPRVNITNIARFDAGWRIGIFYWGNNNNYTVYDSGEAELYNGIGIPLEELLTEQQYVDIPKW